MLFPQPNKNGSMRLWSVHPQYLDSKGLVALWRETLLAKHVLEGKTKGYKNHPQLIRFRATDDPINSINYYLSGIYKEAVARNFSFDKTKIDWGFKVCKIWVTEGQMNFEKHHLSQKLIHRDSNRYLEFQKSDLILPHPIFTIIPGIIESWEKIGD